MKPARRVVEIVVWWALAYAVWLISLSTVPLQELLLAAACALPCGIAAAGTRWAIRDSWWIRVSWLKPMLVLPVAVVTDAAQVLMAGLLRRGGDFQRVSTGTGGDSSSARGRRALAIGLITSTPGSYVLDIDPESGEMLLHSLASRGPRMERQVASTE